MEELNKEEEKKKKKDEEGDISYLTMEEINKTIMKWFDRLCAELATSH